MVDTKHDIFAGLHAKLDRLIVFLGRLERKMDSEKDPNSSGTSNPARNEVCNSGNLQSTCMGKIDFWYFDGENVDGWISRCNQMFEIKDMPENHKIQLASSFIEGYALRWHKIFSRDRFSRDRLTWQDYCYYLVERFRKYSDYSDEFKILKQDVLLTHRRSVVGDEQESSGIQKDLPTTGNLIPEMAEEPDEGQIVGEEDKSSEKMVVTYGSHPLEQGRIPWLINLQEICSPSSPTMGKAMSLFYEISKNTSIIVMPIRCSIEGQTYQSTVLEEQRLGTTWDSASLLCVIICSPLAAAATLSSLSKDFKYFPAKTMADLPKFMWVFREQRLTVPNWRSQRPCLMVGKMDLVPDDSSPVKCNLFLTGYVHAYSLSVKQ